MSWPLLLVAAALATEPAETAGTEAPRTTSTAVVAEADLAASIEALRSELSMQKAEIRALREASNTAVDTASPKDEGPLVIERGQRVPAVVGVGRDVDVRGIVTGDVTAYGGSIRIRPHARVTGDVVAVGGNVNVAPGAVVLGERVALRQQDLAGTGTTWLESTYNALIRRLIFFLSFAGAGVMTVGLFPERVERVASRLSRQPVSSGVLGAVGALALTLTGAFFGITIIGLPVSALLFGLLAVGWLLGLVALAQSLGDRLPLQHKRHGRWLGFLGGTAAIGLLAMLPYLGALALGALSFLGLGAALRTRLGAR